MKNKPLTIVITNILRVLGLLGTSFCITYSGTFDHPIWIIPVIYTIGMFVCNKNITSLTPGILFFNALMFMRYVATPCAYYNDGYINGMATSYNHLGGALALMIFELLFIFIMLEITGRNFMSKIKRLDETKEIQLFEMKFRSGFLFLTMLVLALGYIGVFYKSLGQGWNVLISGALNEFDEIDSLMDSDQGYINIVWQSFSVCLYYFLIVYERNRYEEDKSNKHVIISLVYTFIFVIISFIGATGLTRWYTLVTATASLACLLSLYPYHRKAVGTTILVPLMALMLLSSLIKNGGFEVGSTSMNESAEGAFGATNMDVYFNGLGNVSNAMVLDNSNNDMGLMTFFIDACRNMPIITHYIPNEESSIVAFQKVTGRKDQILPLISQSSIYFSYLFAPLLTILSILLLRRYDLKFLLDNSYTKYAYSFSSVWLASIAMCLNLTIFFMWVYIRIVPFYLILWYINKKSVKTYLVKNE